MFRGFGQVAEFWHPIIRLKSGKYRLGKSVELLLSAKDLYNVVRHVVKQSWLWKDAHSLTDDIVRPLFGKIW